MVLFVKYIWVLLVLSVLIQESFGWWWRRRRRRCSARNCQVSSWSNWSSCSLRCGVQGTQTRSRRKTVGQTCGGTCPYALIETRYCTSGTCHNGGTIKGHYCYCHTGYKGWCCEYDVNECTTSRPCQHTCINTYGSYTCRCNSCYTKLGKYCELRQCRIGGRCYRYGKVNPYNQCQVGWTR